MESNPSSTRDFDVIIVGGGPGGSTLGGLLRKYDPSLNVLIVEREVFPRDHVGESQLPQLGAVLDELGVWDEIERADFPVKVGVTYKWGREGELWDFNLLPPENFDGQERPGKYEGVRKNTAFQVDRARYDEILLRHAQTLGCEVQEGIAVREVEKTGDSIDALILGDGSRVTAKYYVDATGHVGLLRRAMGVAVECPTLLKNIAIWDYWNNTAWADTIGKGGTRVQVMSVGYGWLWFIPISPTRTSLGLICPAKYYKDSGQTPEALYTKAIAASERISGFLEGADRENTLATTNDWSFVAEKLSGPNWFLVGESAGFADPILAAGLTLTQVGAKELAYTILALNQGEHDSEWLKKGYESNQVKRIRHHQRFAEFWYTANSQFTDLQDHCSEIAKEAGLSLSPEKAWAWLAQGGFTNDVLGQVGIGGLDFTALNQVAQRFVDHEIPWQSSGKNVFRLKLDDAEKTFLPSYHDGKVISVECFERAGKRLPVIGLTLVLLRALSKRADIAGIMQDIAAQLKVGVAPAYFETGMKQSMQILEVLVSEGWVEATHNKDLATLSVSTPREGPFIQKNKKIWSSGNRS